MARLPLVIGTRRCVRSSEVDRSLTPRTPAPVQRELLDLKRWDNSQTGRPEVGAGPLVARHGHDGGGGDGRWVGACRLTRLAVATRRLPSLHGLPKPGVVSKMVSWGGAGSGGAPCHCRVEQSEGREISATISVAWVVVFPRRKTDTLCL